MLEDMGVSLTEMDRKVLSTVRGFLALAMGGDHDKAGREMEAHLAERAVAWKPVSEVNRAVSESGFLGTRQGQDGEGCRGQGLEARHTRYLPWALNLGINHDRFWSMTPKINLT
ncbi:MAG: hypothetical protein V8Q42_09065 [Anaerovoracaceae bacterium]